MQAQSGVLVLVASDPPAAGTGTAQAPIRRHRDRGPCSAAAAGLRGCRLRGGLLTLRCHCPEIGDLGEICMDLAGFYGVGVGRLHGVGIGHHFEAVSAWAYDINVSLIRTVRCWLLASWRISRAEAAEFVLKHAKKIAGMAMTAAAVPSAMRIRTAPPFVGRASGVPGSARCRRAPAFAFAPRTASREASSVLAWCRRVCGRLCTAPGMVLGVVLNSLSRSACRQARRNFGWSGNSRSASYFRYAAKISTHRLHPKGRFGFADSNLQGCFPNPCSTAPSAR